MADARGALVALLACACAAWLTFPPPTSAHPFEVTDVDVRLGADAFRVDVRFHVDAMLADVPLGDLSDEQYRRLRAMPDAEIDRRLAMVRRYFEAMVGLRFDGVAVPATVRFPTREGAAVDGRAPLPGHLVRLEGVIPAGARVFTFSAAPVFSTIALRIVGPGGASFEEMLDPLGESRPFPLDAAPPIPGRIGTLRAYARLGFLHIVPRGLDHVFFVLGLYLLSVRFRPLLWQVTAFTLAHSITLACSLYGLVRLPAAVVEPLIALSIAVVAIENLFTSSLMPWRPVVVFVFGLLHGLGFASVLMGLDLPRERFVPALVGFNAGVEGGQLAVILLALAATGRWRNHPRYRARVVVPASAAIAFVGVYWAVARALGGV